MLLYIGIFLTFYIRYCSNNGLLNFQPLKIIMLVVKKTNLMFIFLLFSTICYSHNNDYGKAIIKKWEINKQLQISGSFLLMKNNEVYLQIADNQTVHYPIKSFSEKDQIFINGRYEAIREFNSKLFKYLPIRLN